MAANRERSSDLHTAALHRNNACSPAEKCAVPVKKAVPSTLPNLSSPGEQRSSFSQPPSAHKRTCRLPAAQPLVFDMPAMPTPVLQSSAKAEVAKLLKSLDAAEDAESGELDWAAPLTAAPGRGAATTAAAATGGASASASAAAPSPPLLPWSSCPSCSALQLELERARRERESARAEASRRVAEAEVSARELAAMREAHAVAAVRAEQAAARGAAELAAKAEALERTQAANAQLEAAVQQRQLRIEALESKQAVLLECFRAMEGELAQKQRRDTRQQQQRDSRWQRRQEAGFGGAAQGMLAAEGARSDSLALAVDADVDGLTLAPWQGDTLCGNGSGGLLGASEHAGPTATGYPQESLGSVEQLALSSTHLSLALRCAELQFQLGQQRRAAEAAQQAAAAAQEQAAGLRLLLARQAITAGSGDGGASGGLAAGGGVAAAALGQRLEAACMQLEQAKVAEAQLHQQLTQARRCGLWQASGASGASNGAYEARQFGGRPAVHVYAGCRVCRISCMQDVVHFPGGVMGSYNPAMAVC